MPIASSSLVGLSETNVDRLTPVPLQQRRGFLDRPLMRLAHAEAHAAVPAFREIELKHPAQTAPFAGPLRIAAWNLERCLYPDAAARLLQRHGASLALLTEMDGGMLRTGQARTIARVADALGQGYAYGLEFLELDPMPPPPGFPIVGTDNDADFHGNGIVTSLTIEHATVIRLDEVADWFVAPKGGQRRIGNRMALAATISSGTRVRFLACSVHLESATDGTGRVTQMRTLLDSIDQLADDLPVLIGGDLNTHVQPGGHDDAAEPLFSLAKQRGYDFSSCNLARPTTRDSIWTKSEGTRQLDWFCTRGLVASEPEIVPSLAPDGTALTDHELILVAIG